MFDELERLRSCPSLQRLLLHYAGLGAVDGEAWQDRLMQLADALPKDLVKWHGELLAFGWVEQNTGLTPTCYRVTLQGLRAHRKAMEAAPTM